MPDRHQTKSKYTADRQIPGAFEGETVTRRRFMTGTVHVAGAVAMSAIALPSLGFALGPIFESNEVEWQALGAQLAGQLPHGVHEISANAAAATSTVRSTCSGPCASEGNQAS